MARVSDEKMKEIMQTAAEMAGVDDVGELSDGFHTFNSLYKRRRERCHPLGWLMRAADSSLDS